MHFSCLQAMRTNLLTRLLQKVHHRRNQRRFGRAQVIRRRPLLFLAGLAQIVAHPTLALLGPGNAAPQFANQLLQRFVLGRALPIDTLLQVAQRALHRLVHLAHPIQRLAGLALAQQLANLGQRLAVIAQVALQPRRVQTARVDVFVRHHALLLLGRGHHPVDLLFHGIEQPFGLGLQGRRTAFGQLLQGRHELLFGIRQGLAIARQRVALLGRSELPERPGRLLLGRHHQSMLLLHGIQALHRRVAGRRRVQPRHRPRLVAQRFAQQALDFLQVHRGLLASEHVVAQLRVQVLQRLQGALLLPGQFTPVLQGLRQVLLSRRRIALQAIAQPLRPGFDELAQFVQVAGVVALGREHPDAHFLRVRAPVAVQRVVVRRLQVHERHLARSQL